MNPAAGNAARDAGSGLSDRGVSDTNNARSDACTEVVVLWAPAAEHTDTHSTDNLAAVSIAAAHGSLGAEAGGGAAEECVEEDGVEESAAPPLEEPWDDGASAASEVPAGWWCNITSRMLTNVRTTDSAAVERAVGGVGGV